MEEYGGRGAFDGGEGGGDVEGIDQDFWGDQLSVRFCGWFCEIQEGLRYGGIWEMGGRRVEG